MFSVEFLILGAGWTSNFLIPQLKEEQISYASTSRSGNGDTLKFEFTPDSHDPTPFQSLPTASTVLITFPIKNIGGSKLLVDLYLKTHPKAKAPVNFIQLGSTGIFTEPGWSNRHSKYNKADLRAIAEDELLSLSHDSIRTTVLNLSGLWGGERKPRNWVTRVGSTKELLASKVRERLLEDVIFLNKTLKTSLHLVHGVDIARSIIAVHQHFDKAAGSRWILTDQRIYDWWDLASAWGDGGADSEEVKGPQPQWVGELMDQNGLRALPRSPEVLGKSLDSREFWSTFGLEPVKGRVN